MALFCRLIVGGDLALNILRSKVEVFLFDDEFGLTYKQTADVSNHYPVGCQVEGKGRRGKRKGCDRKEEEGGLRRGREERGGDGRGDNSLNIFQMPSLFRRSRRDVSPPPNRTLMC